ncbi:subclass B3 metallo-beta-lactamase [Erythrobacter sp. W53]|uniref:subclass B3 metallo-beta-lactamase n=1 Tax=Erythrobacter sp. W53 TaxID=3425947 RepID=UPI003D766767
MFGRVLSLALALVLTACAPADAQTNTTPPSPETSSISKWKPYPGTSKDAEFFKNTPDDFHPFVAACDPWDDWDKPAPPFKVYGNTYYVGTCGISALLLVGNDEHVLIDSGTEAGAEIVLRNIKSLGFDPKDISYILYSHEHFDHVGGHAIVQKATGATVLGNRVSGPVFKTGLSPSDDPQHGMHDAMAPVDNVRVLEQLGTVIVGRLSINGIDTPGHSPGALSWHWQSCEGENCLTLVYADSLSPISREGFRFTDDPLLLARHEKGLEELAKIDCQILLTPHPSSSKMLKRMRTGKVIESGACAYYAMDRWRAMEKRLLDETAEVASD